MVQTSPVASVSHLPLLCTPGNISARAALCGRYWNRRINSSTSDKSRSRPSTVDPELCRYDMWYRICAERVRIQPKNACYIMPIVRLPPSSMNWIINIFPEI